MITLRKGTDRGQTQISWLKSFHTFAFGNYYDPEFVGFRSLRVINEDTVQPGMGFGRHEHQNMEIISYVIEGSLKHADNMGNGSIIHPGEIQCMSAGTGVEHSELNHSSTNPVHFLQIWIIPDKNGLVPRYQQNPIPQSKNKLVLIGSNKEQPDAIQINQDVMLYSTLLEANHTITYAPENNRGIWLQLVKGELIVNGHHLNAGDGMAITHEEINITSVTHSELLVVDLA